MSATKLPKLSKAERRASKQTPHRMFWAHVLGAGLGGVIGTVLAVVAKKHFVPALGLADPDGQDILTEGDGPMPARTTRSHPASFSET